MLPPFLQVFVVQQWSAYERARRRSGSRGRGLLCCAGQPLHPAPPGDRRGDVAQDVGVATEASLLRWPILRETPFPVLGNGARCPFCQQVISEEAGARLQHFAEYVSSTAQARVREAEGEHRKAIGTVTQVTIMRPEIDLAITELLSENPALATEVRAFLDNDIGRVLEGNRREALGQGVGFLSPGVRQSPGG